MARYIIEIEVDEKSLFDGFFQWEGIEGEEKQDMLDEIGDIDNPNIGMMHNALESNIGSSMHTGCSFEFLDIIKRVE